jgi:hypothetical protein
MWDNIKQGHSLRKSTFYSAVAAMVLPTPTSARLPAFAWGLQNHTASLAVDKARPHQAQESPGEKRNRREDTQSTILRLLGVSVLSALCREFVRGRIVYST